MNAIDRLIHYFLPLHLRLPLYAEHDSAKTVVSGLLVGGSAVFLLITPLLYWFPEMAYYYLPAFGAFGSLFLIKKTGNVLWSTVMTFVLAYIALLFLIRETGGIFSVHVATLYVLLLTGFRVSRAVGHVMTFVHLLMLVVIYMVTESERNLIMYSFSNKEYHVMFHEVLCVFFATFFSFTQRTQDSAKASISVDALTELAAVYKRVEQMRKESEKARKNVARDYYEETGHILAAMGRQMMALKQNKDNAEAVDVQLALMNRSCEKLMDASRDYLWSLDQESSNPMVVFDRLSDYGRNYFAQCGIAFYANPLGNDYRRLFTMDRYASRNLMLTFKEAMTNAALHSQATHVKLEMLTRGEHVRILLKDNGRWKPIDSGTAARGLSAMEQRCKQHDMVYRMQATDEGTCIEVVVPVSRS